MIYYRTCIKSNTTAANSGAGTAYTSGPSMFFLEIAAFDYRFGIFPSHIP
jgi:hypothetical protein